LENQTQTEKKEIEANFTDLISFFRNDRSELQKTITEEIKKFKALLEFSKQFPTKTLMIENTIQRELEQHDEALSELEKAISFYSQF